MKVWGYARVSTDAQDERMQLDALDRTTPKPDRVFIDHGISGKNFDRAEWLRLMDIAREGDTIVFYSLSRATRSTIDALTLMAELDSRGILYRSLTESIDNSTPAGRAMTALIAVFAQLEREQTVQRTKDGLRAARERGVILGRKPSLSPTQRKQAVKLAASGSTAKEIGESFGVSERTVYRVLAAQQ